MRLKIAICATLLLFIAVDASNAKNGPSFSCDRASSEVERAICNDPALSVADKELAEAFGNARSAAGPEFQLALVADQKQFLLQRDQAFALGPSTNQRLERLAFDIKNRTKILRSVSTTGRTGLLGKWRNASGMVEVTRAASGHLHFTAETVDQVKGSWVCSLDIYFDPEKESQVSLPTNDGTVTLKVVSEHLVVADPDEHIAPSYCGNGGQLGGVFFPVATPEN